MAVVTMVSPLRPAHTTTYVGLSGPFRGRFRSGKKVGVYVIVHVLAPLALSTY